MSRNEIGIKSLSSQVINDEVIHVEMLMEFFSTSDVGMSMLHKSTSFPQQFEEGPGKLKAFQSSPS